MSNDTNGTSSAASCNKGHVFFYAGTPPIPDGFPCACGLTKYRSSLLSNDGIHDLMPPNDNIGASVDRSVGGLIVRDHYEALIASGELIVKSELVEWLEKQRDDHSASHGNSYTEEAITYDNVLDHLNKKTS